MNIFDYAKHLFFSPDLESKLLCPSIVDDFSGEVISEDVADLYPARDESISFSDEQVKFPRKGALRQDEKKGLALHFFANHELLAIEMMAAAILFLKPSKNIEHKEIQKLRRGLLTTILDEQKHFKLYQNRMQEFGCRFGDYPLNDFFWRQMQKVKSLDEYLSVMAITFEGANLDFAHYYREVFKEIGDSKTSSIMNVVYEDEITHVALGAHWLNKWREDESIWNYYLNSLPELLTPSRAKGIIYDEEARTRAGLDSDFIKTLKVYKDDFTVTQRKEWNASK